MPPLLAHLTELENLGVSSQADIGKEDKEEALCGMIASRSKRTIPVNSKEGNAFRSKKKKKTNNSVIRIFLKS